MWQVVYTVPGLGVRVHGFSLAFLAACLGALFLSAWRARREGMSADDVYDLALWLMPGGLIGARVFFIAMHPETIRSVGDVFRIWEGGIVFYGCIAGGLTGSLIFWWKRRYPLRAMCDVVAPALVLGAALGRVGCFLNGCCYGAISRLPWAVTFPAGSLPWGRHVHAGLIPPTAARSLPLHPTQLYDCAGDLALLALLTWFFPRRKRDGEVMGVLMIGYPALRFLVECLRDDEGAIFAGLGAAQLISLGLIAGAVVLWRWLPNERRFGGAPSIQEVPAHPKFARKGQASAQPLR